ncbi:16S rRNA (guanine(1207)-N(2))-methyltransferase RsmC [Vibrio furnissii]|uniref:16S rRNA (guanine(1207)-N(2))-methyltransferase RsmC n=1 Tax=Vibrio furnissii TaxID=29494 RepID=UPI0001B92002|nr:16S rRNA (guanine(1207)-N(2))-methyltransferase RsmC [Vibrio furnissii]EEX38984.1 ribosomal RNA small subunit methyltransferase C [Vibrio furnissii CIP 102972]QDC93983.1 16S rRNA (guanine(1207)-N(2))-methyltransferase RsmC [Vibrio furnissii]UON47394.1 16S rRNA (guanine(1207)-N(2))-methyltransferase RsmC [Vibrio furnissii]SUP46468.1 16S RNA G1207 methylase RsmC [Vibrio furnissii]
MSNYIAPSQIAQRQLAYFEGKHVLVAGEAEDLFPLELAKHCASVSVFTTNYGYYRQLHGKSALHCYFGAELVDDVHADMVLLYWPKAKLEAEYLLAMLMAKLGENTEIVVVGENRSGVKSIEKMFAAYGPINKYDSARRCSFYWGQCTQAVKPFILGEWFKSYAVQYHHHTLTVRSLPGVFSHGEFDMGSRLLLDTLPPLQGKVLDFGCGAGVLGGVMAMLYPNIALEMCDISALAIRSSQETLAANGLSGRVFASDVYSDTASDYQFIVTNPPFHAGLDTSYNATETLLAKAPAHLQRQGQLVVVANSFLKYPPIIEQAFGNCETLNKTNKFTIYHAHK